MLSTRWYHLKFDDLKIYISKDHSAPEKWLCLWYLSTILIYNNDNKDDYMMMVMRMINDNDINDNTIKVIRT